ncbi:MAG: DUF5132 domain-containing protein [Actinomycetota bacterium]|nr:DUF5132 domain-containing protein [Actinomycetota bacterium]
MTAPLVGTIIKPLLRGTIKATVALALETKRLAAQAGEELQDLAAEVSADMAAQTAVSARAEKTAVSTEVFADMATKTGRSRGARAAWRGTVRK